MSKMKTKEVVNGKKISIQEKFTEARFAMNEAMVERNEEVDLVLTAMLCKEHVVFVGPPGTGKSLLLESLMGWVEKTSVFKYLLTKFTDPSELFGPVNVKGMINGDQQRIIDHSVATSELIFMDEVWKASSSILNSLLTLLNERKFHYCKQSINCPLRICVAASNEWPDPNEGGKELCAIFDRFLFRKQVPYVSKVDGRKQLLKKAINNDPCEPIFKDRITLNELDKAHSEAMSLNWTNEAKKALWSILEELDKEKINVGDRRLGKAIGAARAYCYLNGDKEVLPTHLEVLQHVLWDDPSEEVIKKCSKVINTISNPMGTLIAEKMAAMTSILENSKPYEAAAKLKSLKEELEKMPADPRRDRAVAMCQMHLQDIWDKVVK